MLNKKAPYFSMMDDKAKPGGKLYISYGKDTRTRRQQRAREKRSWRNNFLTLD